MLYKPAEKAGMKDDKSTEGDLNQKIVGLQQQYWKDKISIDPLPIVPNEMLTLVLQAPHLEINGSRIIGQSIQKIYHIKSLISSRNYAIFCFSIPIRISYLLIPTAICRKYHISEPGLVSIGYEYVITPSSDLPSLLPFAATYTIRQESNPVNSIQKILPKPICQISGPQ